MRTVLSRFVLPLRAGWDGFRELGSTGAYHHLVQADKLMCDSPECPAGLFSHLFRCICSLLSLRSRAIAICARVAFAWDFVPIECPTMSARDRNLWPFGRLTLGILHPRRPALPQATSNAWPPAYTNTHRVHAETLTLMEIHARRCMNSPMHAHRESVVRKAEAAAKKLSTINSSENGVSLSPSRLSRCLASLPIGGPELQVFFSGTTQRHT